MTNYLRGVVRANRSFYDQHQPIIELHPKTLPTGLLDRYSLHYTHIWILTRRVFLPEHTCEVSTGLIIFERLLTSTAWAARLIGDLVKIRDPYRVHKYVPYVIGDLRPGVRRHLPAGPKTPITAKVVSRFISETRKHPEDRLAVLSVLRTHAANGAEVPLSLVALMVAALAVLATSQSDIPYFALGVSTALVILIASIVKMASAAHLRRLTATVWLRAYEDGLSGNRKR